MKWLLALTILCCSTAAAQTEQGPYARIAFLRPHEGKTIDFEAGYIRHLDWHRQANDKFVWYGWSIWAGERQRWFVYATFGHPASSFDAPVAPAEDERDNVANVVPHAQFAGNGVYEFLPALSRGTGTPSATARLELITMDLEPGSQAAFEASLASEQPPLQSETLWFRMVAGGPAPRYLRLRPRATLAGLVAEKPLPDKIARLTERMSIEILTLRPTMSYGVTPARP